MAARSLVLAAALSAVFTTAMLAARGWEPTGWSPATCLPDRCFCEAPRAAFPRQPADTWSNAAYVIAGGLLLGRGRLLFGALCVALGFGSAWFHGTLTLAGEWLDVWAMYAVVGLMIAEDLGRPDAFYAIGAFYAALQTWYPGRVWPFAVELAALLALEARLFQSRSKRGRLAVLGGLACFGLALVVWVPDRSGAWCAPESALQGHALWHVLCAAALFLVALRAE